MERIRPRAAGANLSVDVDGHNLPLPRAPYNAPRIDTIGRDGEEVFARNGTPTIGANLLNLAGAAPCPEDKRLGWVLVPANAVAITAANIRCWDAALEARLRELEAEITRDHRV